MRNRDVMLKWNETGAAVRERFSGFAGRLQVARDAALAARVRRILRRTLSRPHEVDVSVYGGQITLSGVAPRAEGARVIERVSALRSARGVENLLDFQDWPLGAAAPNTGAWPLAVRLAVGLAGGAAVVAALRRRGVRGLPIALAGATAIVRATANRRLRPSSGVDVFRTIAIRATPAAVYDLWSRFESYPRLLRHVKSVASTSAENEWLWTVEAPGRTAAWTVWVTENIPGKSIAWESAPGSAVRSAGVVQFTDTGAGRTRLDIRLSYGLRDFGATLSSGLEKDLLRAKAYLESADLPGGSSRVENGRS